MSKVSQLVLFAKADTTNTHKEINFGIIPNFQAQDINGKTGVYVRGCKRILNTSGIRHAFNGHGNQLKENERGQIGIIDIDFELLTEIFNTPDSVVRGNNNSRGQHAVVFIKKIGIKTYHVVMSLVESRKELNLVFSTMYIKK